MIYLKRNNLLIRELCEADIEPIVAGEIAQGWLGASREKYDMRLRDAAEGRCAALCAELQGRPAGYVNLYFKAYPPYAETAWPEIVDFGVLEIYRNRGHGTDGCGRGARRKTQRYGLPRRRPAQRLRRSPAHVREARLYSGRHRRVVSGEAARAVRALRQRRRPEPVFYKAAALNFCRRMRGAVRQIISLSVT